MCCQITTQAMEAPCHFSAIEKRGFWSPGTQKEAEKKAVARCEWLFGKCNANILNKISGLWETSVVRLCCSSAFFLVLAAGLLCFALGAEQMSSLVESAELQHGSCVKDWAPRGKVSPSLGARLWFLLNFCSRIWWFFCWHCSVSPA